MAQYRYVGMKYKQGEAETELITFCARASEIMEWGGVPAKNERFHGGFQRALSARYKKIIDFFNAKQTSPGAIVVAFREGMLKSDPLGVPETWNTDALTLQPDLVSISFSVEDDDSLTLDELRQRVLSLLDARLIGQSLTDEPSAEDNEQDALQDEAGELSESDEKEGEEGEEELDVGQSKLKAFFQFLSDPNKIKEWIADQELKIASTKSKPSLSRADKEYIAFTPEERLKATLRSLIRPAMIVDGQHRVNGANESESNDIVFTVCAIRNADWVEQVFQFVVLNKMARPISKDFLTELLNTSLTNDEIDDIEKKLVSVGIKSADQTLHKYLNYDPRSPFADMVAEASEVIGFDRTGKLSQQGMLAVAKRWRNINSNKPGKNLEMQMFMPALGVSKLTEARAKWKTNDVWIGYFFAFWEVIKKKYSAAQAQVWVKRPSFHLLYIVTLQALQDEFLERKSNGGSKFQSLEDFKAQVEEFFDPVPPGFFQDWTATGLQSGTGWADIKEAIHGFRQGQRLSDIKSTSRLFK
jgi:hypothetical protein